jgi:hypothetical protein
LSLLGILLIQICHALEVKGKNPQGLLVSCRNVWEWKFSCNSPCMQVKRGAHAFFFHHATLVVYSSWNSCKRPFSGASNSVKKIQELWWQRQAAITHDRKIGTYIRGSVYGYRAYTVVHLLLYTSSYTVEDCNYKVTVGQYVIRNDFKKATVIFF